MNKQITLSAFTDELAQTATKKKEFLDENRTNAFFELQDNLAAQTTADSAPQWYPYPDNLPEDMAWSSAPYTGEEVGPYVYTGDMSRQDCTLMHRQSLVHYAPAEHRSDTLQQWLFMCIANNTEPKAVLRIQLDE